MDAVSFQPVDRGTRALVDGNAYTGVLQAMSQAQATDTAADDDDMEWLIYFRLLWNARSARDLPNGSYFCLQLFNHRRPCPARFARQLISRPAPAPS
jgi:hypothetical protein